MCLAVVWLCYLEQDKEVQEFGEALFQKESKNEWQARVPILFRLDKCAATYDELMFPRIPA